MALRLSPFFQRVSAKPVQSAGIPMILWLKNGDKGGSCRQPVTLQDVYTTILEYCGVPVPEEADGQNLLPACYGESLPRKYVHGEHSPCYSREEAMQYITDGRWKYIWFTASGKEQLFCLADQIGRRNHISIAV